MNAVTPKSSPIPTPKHRKGEVEVLIPPNMSDPLSLAGCEDSVTYEDGLVSPKKVRKSRKRRKKSNASAVVCMKGNNADEGIKIAREITNEDNVSETVLALKPEVGEVMEFSLKDDIRIQKCKGDVTQEKRRRLDVKDKIVSPVVPQSGAWKKKRGNKQLPQKMPKFQDKNTKYQYGNYNRYYGYRNPSHEDVRLKCFSERHIFDNKDVLDVGCNIGHITLSVARDFGARSVVGLDIDGKLIDIARKNVRHYANFTENGGTSSYPSCMPTLFGNVDICSGTKFPHNVTFVQGNYVLDSDILLQTEEPRFDVILCLSLTKWLHLNWGDVGLKRAFRRSYAQLRPGGRLILEVQSWDSYKRKKTLTETIYNNYNNIEFRPHHFTQYLLSPEVGFSRCETIGIPCHQSRGFQRPIQMYTKAATSTATSDSS